MQSAYYNPCVFILHIYLYVYYIYILISYFKYFFLEIIQESIKSYIGEHNETFQTISVFDCRGCDLTAYDFRVSYFSYLVFIIYFQITYTVLNFLAKLESYC